MRNHIRLTSILALTLLASFIGFPKANATKIHTFEGEIIAFGFDWGIDTEDDPFLGFKRGGEKRGSYSYKSATIDGTFSLADGTLELDGVLDGKNLGAGGTLSSTLVIEGGIVKSFDYRNFPTEASFNSSDSWFSFDSLVFGSFTITDPKRVSDTGSTVLLLGAGLLGLIAIRRRMGRSR